MLPWLIVYGRIQKGWSSNWTLQLKLLPFSKESIAKPDIFMWFMAPVVLNHKWQSRLIDCTTFNLILGSSLSKAFFGRWYNICARHQVFTHTYFIVCANFFFTMECHGLPWLTRRTLKSPPLSHMKWMGKAEKCAYECFFTWFLV